MFLVEKHERSANVADGGGWTEVATPVDWRLGDKIIVSLSVPTDEARERFDDVEEFYPYLRTARLRSDA